MTSAIHLSDIPEKTPSGIFSGRWKKIRRGDAVSEKS